MDRKAWIERSKRVRSDADRYSYELLPNNIRKGSKVKLVCLEHGPFVQNEQSFRMGYGGCRLCRKRVAHNRKSVDEWIAKARKVHGNTYTYLIDSEDVTSQTPIWILCRKHGWFRQRLANHTTHRQGCKACGFERMRGALKKDRRHFVNQMRRVHAGAYGYWAIPDNVHANMHVDVYCPKHGWFRPLVHNHISHRSGCPKCMVGKGKLESDVASLFPGATQNKRGVLGAPCTYRHEIDVFWEDKGVGVEIHGAAWHSSRFRADAKTHIADKADAASEVGIRLLQIYDFEWHNRRGLFSKLVLSALGKFDAVYDARKLTIKPVKADLYRPFLELYHHQRSRDGSCFGLFDGHSLVMLATFGRSRFLNGYIELYRVAAKSGVRVRGGLSRLVKHIFETTEQPILTYADRRIFTGAAYERVGFRFLRKTEPGYIYVDVNGNPVGGRLQYQKHKLKHTLQKFDPEKSEEDNMRMNGLYRLYDAGCNAYVYGEAK